MKKFSRISGFMLAIAACTLIFSNCFSPYAGENDTSLTIILPGASDARAAWGTDADDIGDLVYTISLSGPDGTIQVPSSAGQTSYTVSVNPGTWTITVIATRPGGTGEYAVANETVNILPGHNTPIQITLKRAGAYTIGFGGFTGPASILTDNTETYTFTADFGSLVDDADRMVTFALSGNNNLATIITPLSATYTTTTSSIPVTLFVAPGETASSLRITASFGAEKDNPAAAYIDITVVDSAGWPVDKPQLFSAPGQTNISIRPVPLPGSGQNVEYAISTNSTPPTSGWSASRDFTSLTAGTVYYIFARSAANTTHTAGTPNTPLVAITQAAGMADWTPLPGDNTDTVNTIPSGNYRVNANSGQTVNRRNLVISSGTVNLYIPAGVTLNVTGSPGTGTTAGRAAINLPAGATLILRGGGTLNATGGNAAGGLNASTGTLPDSTFPGATVYTGTFNIRPGRGRTGSAGGGGAGAGIGTDGGVGGDGGAQPEVHSWTREISSDPALPSTVGHPGPDGSDGGNSNPMGTLYVLDSVTVTAAGGIVGANGGPSGSANFAQPATREAGYAWTSDGSRYHRNGYGGGSGGSGGGGAASGIGSGGVGGGGSGSGGSGGLVVQTSQTQSAPNGFGGFGGMGGDGNPGNTGHRYPSTPAPNENDDVNAGPGGNGGNAGNKGGEGTVNLAPGTGAQITAGRGPGDIATPSQLTPFITYNANDGSLGAIVTPQHRYTANAPVFITGIIPTRPGHFFTGWNTAADGSGTWYSANMAYTGVANLNLFAQWQAN